MKNFRESFSFYGVRYIVRDIEAAVSFYTEILGFKVEMKVPPGFAKLSRGPLDLYLNKADYGGAGQTMPDGAVPTPGGFNRIQFKVDRLEELVEDLKGKKARFRNELVNGIGGKQILLMDPSDNLIELFEPKEQTSSGN